jgi:HemK-like putative methylase
MPRLPPTLLRRAHRLSPHLRTLLPACRDLSSARNELRWIREHLESTPSKILLERRLSRACRKRGQGEPLQYLLGTQPFGNLDIRCQPGVLIPRPETEAYTLNLSSLLTESTSRLRKLAGEGKSLDIVDFCTGTGCIALLLFSTLQKTFPQLQVRGIDISQTAVDLARENLRKCVQNGQLPSLSRDQRVSFMQGNIFDDAYIHTLATHNCDVLVSNPPYVSKDDWLFGRGRIGYSVRKYEPKLALVPNDNFSSYAECHHADVFYARLLAIVRQLKPKILLLEVGDEDQARRVVNIALQQEHTRDSHFEIWRDWPDSYDAAESQEAMAFLTGSIELKIPIRGTGNIRSILITKAPIN